jgi:hypothetical protein
MSMSVRERLAQRAPKFAKRDPRDGVVAVAIVRSDDAQVTKALARDWLAFRANRVFGRAAKKLRRYANAGLEPSPGHRGRLRSRRFSAAQARGKGPL